MAGVLKVQEAPGGKARRVTVCKLCDREATTRFVERATGKVVAHLCEDCSREVMPLIEKFNELPTVGDA